ncbi:hypothetical protein D3C75_1001870 [compost metagenome]
MGEGSLAHAALLHQAAGNDHLNVLPVQLFGGQIGIRSQNIGGVVGALEFFAEGIDSQIAELVQLVAADDQQFMLV